VSNQYNEKLVAGLHRATNSETWTAEKNADLHPRVAAGDKKARETMLSGNMPLVLSKVEAFIRSFPSIAHLRDDLVSAGCVGLVKAVNKMARGEGPRITDPDAPTDFIGMWMNRELGVLVDAEHTIRLPARAKYRARANGQELEAPEGCNAIPERFEVPSYQEELEIRDLIDSCCAGEDERTLVAMREAGHTLVEIGTAIGKSRMAVQRMSKQIDARVQRKLEALRNE